MTAAQSSVAEATPIHPVSVGIDVGGTFTDLVAFVDGRVVTAKVRSVREDQAAAVLAALERSGVPANAVDVLAHGTTVATNALLERRGARTALVTTDGFRDVIEIGRQNRPKLYDLTASPPAPLVARELRFTIPERVGPAGVARELDDPQLRTVIEAVRESGAESVAVCLLFSFAHPEHEERVQAALREAIPGAYVARSSEVLPEFREYERFATTTANAYLGPVIASYLGRLDARLREIGVGRPLIMLSSGGVIDMADAAGQASQCVLSGPAAGAVAGAWVAAQSGHRDLLTFDMGGTSTDVALVLDGEAQVTTSSVISGIPVGHPMVDIHTVSSGGGSIAWIDSGAALRVGPRSAGGDPGPACYGLGGEDATVTDAHLMLGYLRDGARFGDAITLERPLAQRAIAALAGRLGLESEQVAAGIIAVAEAEMARALRVVSIERGIDPRTLTLVAFGGAGGVHACSLAEELRMTRVLIPRSAGVLSALGLAISDLRRDYARAFFAPLDGVAVPAGLEEAFAELEERARADLPDPACERLADARYAGQSFELTVTAGDPQTLAARFHEAHRRRYDYALEDDGIELVALRVHARVPGARPEPSRFADAGARAPAPPTTRVAYFEAGWSEARVLDADALTAGERIVGPAIIEYPVATAVVRPGWSGTVDANGAVVLERDPTP